MRRPGLTGILIAAAATAVVVVGAVAGTAAVGARDTAVPSTPEVFATEPATNPLAAGGLQDPARGAEIRDIGDVVPTGIRIPAIGVDAGGMELLGIGAAGELEAPVDYDLPGWFTEGPVPGQVGPAIIAGHVDSPTGPAVFLRIGELAVGSEVLVDLSDGTVATFEVTGSQQSPKAQFPTSDVYSSTPRPELRLITCSGAFDRSIGHYSDNLIVYATLQA